MHTKSESIRKWSGDGADFKIWAEHFMDHMVLVHPEWKPFLRYMATTDENMSFERLKTEWIGPYKENALDLSVKIEQLICNWIPERFYRRRVQLA